MNTEVSQSNRFKTCPSCKKENHLSAAYEVRCGHCTHVLERYEEKSNSEGSWLTNIVLIASLTGGATYGLSAYKDYKRYDIAVEYAILSTCKNDGNMSKSRLYGGAKNEMLHNTCICSLKKTQNEVSFHDYQYQTRKFMDVFERHYKECWLDAVEKGKRAD